MLSIYTLNSGRPTPDPESGRLVDQVIRTANAYAPYVIATYEQWQREMRELKVGDLLLVYHSHRLPAKDGGVVRAVIVCGDPYDGTHSGDDGLGEPGTYVPVITVARSLPVRLSSLPVQPKTRPGGVLCPTSLESWQEYVRLHAIKA
jgi:hypothetical protein